MNLTRTTSLVFDHKWHIVLHLHLTVQPNVIGTSKSTLSLLEIWCLNFLLKHTFRTCTYNIQEFHMPHLPISVPYVPLQWHLRKPGPVYITPDPFSGRVKTLEFSNTQPINILLSNLVSVLKSNISTLFRFLEYFSHNFVPASSIKEAHCYANVPCRKPSLQKLGQLVECSAPNCCSFFCIICFAITYHRHRLPVMHATLCHFIPSAALVTYWDKVINLSFVNLNFQIVWTNIHCPASTSRSMHNTAH